MSNDWNSSNYVSEIREDDDKIRDNWDDEDPVSDNWEQSLENKPKEVGDKPRTTTGKSNQKSLPTVKDETIQNSTEVSQNSSQPAAEQKKDSDVPTAKSSSLDDILLTTREQMIDYSLRLTNHLQPLLSSEHCPEFLDHFLNGITKSMSVDQVKRLNAVLEAALIRKDSDEREKLKKTKKKKIFKPQLADKTRKGTDSGGLGHDDDYDYDDDDSQ